MEKRLQREQKERCFLLKGAGISGVRSEFLASALAAFEAAKLPETAKEWVALENGRMELRDREQPWTGDERQQFSVIKTVFVEQWRQLRPEHLEYVNVRSNGWIEGVIHLTTVPIQVMENITNLERNPFRRYGCDLIAKRKAMGKGKGKAVAEGVEGGGDLGDAAGAGGAGGGAAGVPAAVGGQAGGGAAAAPAAGKGNFVDMGNMFAQMQAMFNGKGRGRNRSNRRGGKQGGKGNGGK